MPSDIEDGYNRVAADYAGEYLRELGRKPFDQDILNRFAVSMRRQGPVCDVGCGPGHIARYLSDRGVSMRGIDLSAEMIAHARRLHPGIDFDRCDMLDLDFADATLGGIICFYAIIHIPRADVPRALAQMWRVLRPQGRLLLSFHGGEGTLHREEWYGKTVSIDVTMFEREEMERYLTASGFEVEEIAERPPYPFEYQTRRLYAFARKR
jgi:SAM-dependent methyltransferase